MTRNRRNNLNTAAATKKEIQNLDIIAYAYKNVRTTGITYNLKKCINQLIS